MNLDHLKYFVITSETLHTAKAAKILHVSQSTISHSIKKLEDELGNKLFDNIGKRIYLTELGKAFTKQARELLEHSEKIKSQFRSNTLPLEGTIRIGTTHGLANLLIGPLIGELYNKNPGIVFEVYSLRSSQVVEHILAKTIDVGICFGPTPHPEFVELLSQKVSLKIAVTPSHPLLKTTVSVAKLNTYPSATPKAFGGIEVCDNHPEIKKHKIKSETHFIYDSYDVAATFLKSTNAWGLIPEILIPYLGLKSLNFKDWKANTKISVLVPKGRIIPSQIEKSINDFFIPLIKN